MRTVERHLDAVDAHVDSELVVMNINSLDYYRFNEVAGRIWELIGSARISEDALCVALQEEYDVSEAQCRSSVATFLDEALSRGFLRTA